MKKISKKGIIESIIGSIILIFVGWMFTQDISISGETENKIYINGYNSALFNINGPYLIKNNKYITFELKKDRISFDLSNSNDMLEKNDLDFYLLSENKNKIKFNEYINNKSDFYNKFDEYDRIKKDDIPDIIEYNFPIELFDLNSEYIILNNEVKGISIPFKIIDKNILNYIFNYFK